jgi:hypothetical protein
VKTLLLALALLAPPGVHYQGTVGTGAVQWVPAGVLTIDTTSSADTSAGGTTAAISLSTTGTNRLIVVLAPSASNGPSNDVSGVSGSTLGAFTKIVGTTTTDTSGFASVWAALASSQLSSETITVTWAASYLSFTKHAAAISFYNHKSTSTLASNFGGTNTIQGTGSIAAAIAVTATAAGSYVVASMIDWNSSAARTMRGDSTAIRTDANDGAGDLYMSHRSSSATSGSGSVTVGTSAPTDAQLYAAAVEVLSGP